MERVTWWATLALGLCIADPRKPFGVLLNAWNEWTEGCYLLPEERTGNGCLEAVKRVFGAAKSAS